MAIQDVTTMMKRYFLWKFVLDSNSFKHFALKICLILFPIFPVVLKGGPVGFAAPAVLPAHWPSVWVSSFTAVYDRNVQDLLLLRQARTRH